MQALEKIRLSAEQEVELEAGELITIPASWEEFEEFLSETDYRVEYHNGQIIVMGLAKIIHEVLVARFVYFLTGFYLGKPFYVAGSNAGIRKDNKKGHYNGDVLVIKENPVYQGKSRSIITNPYLIVEVLSKSTLNYDLGAKRRKYEQMETLQELVFVDPFDKEVIVCRRTEQANVWTETAYTLPEQVVDIDGFHIPVSEIFANLPEE
ncbi:Uma2 family endonuclease [Spirosoma sp. BT702]|uniref:Uma2 family endonuclease n=1 Tax=Spirosoma profusum TaxID=2771354 RepID=A0A926XT09_9BACT|nr:Uma2 family endonuclease [Spirosoma profusum]MBD2699604.1 Uma2 family endonuclease [Spirosoma profusum]